MASLIPGFEYDIFISYRQKDNKGDHWVSGFVEALKTELESTFKEEISIYFDENPHDGLLETHDIHASLKEKLKCLIFIPIISRTYCDPKSFAWKHEFKAFVNSASDDQLGFKVKVRNGNIANRVLPVRIHELERSDLMQCEQLLGGILRSVDFVYKTAGVNRPLRPKEENPGENLSRTFYRDQVNKVANSIKEIINGLKNETIETVPLEDYSEIKKKRPGEKSIIVLPFENMSPDKDQEYFSDGLTEEIITDLAHIKDLIVISRSSAMTFKNTKKTIPEIASAVNVRYVLEGSVRRAGDRLRITAQLIDSENDAHIWAEKYDGSMEDVFGIQEKVSLSIVSKLKLKLSSKEETRVREKAFKDIRSFEFFLKSKEKIYSLDIDKAIEYLEKALEIEGENSHLYAQLAHAYYQYWNFGIRIDEQDIIKARTFMQKAFTLDSESSDGLFVSALLEGLGGDFLNSISLLKGTLQIAPNHSDSLGWLTLITCFAGSEDCQAYYDKLCEIDPFFPLLNIVPVFRNIYTGNFDMAASIAMKLDYSDVNYFTRAYALLFTGKYEEAENSLEKFSAGFNESYLRKIISLLVHSLSGKKLDEFILNDEKFILWARNDFQYSHFLAELYSILVNKNEALNWLENSVDRGLINYSFINHLDPFLENIRGEERFKELMHKLRQKQFLLPHISMIEG